MRPQVTLYNFNPNTPEQISREKYYDVGAGDNTLGDVRRAFIDFEIWDAPAGGNQLTLDTDYELRDRDNFLSLQSGLEIYSAYRILNPAYQTGAIYITYKIVMSYNNSLSDNLLILNNQENAIINGCMRVAQSGGTFAAIAAWAYSLDQWQYVKSGAMVHTINQSTTVPALGDSYYSLHLDVTTADAAIAAGDLCHIQTFIEGHDFRKFVGRTATLGFWVRDTITGIHCISFRNSAADRSYVAEYTINEADTWEFKTITLDFNYSGGTWDYINGIGIIIAWALAAGATYQTTAGTWQNGNYTATANQVNAVNSTSNNFYISEARLVLGDYILPWNARSFQSELALCQRYFEKSYTYGVAPGAVTNVGETENIALSTYIMYDSMVFLVMPKRTEPAITYYSPVTGASGQWRDYTGGADVAPTQNGRYITTKQFSTWQNNSLVAGRVYGFHWIADARF